MVYVWLDSFAVHLRLSEQCLLISHTPIQNKTFKKIPAGIMIEIIKPVYQIWVNGHSHSLRSCNP